MPDQQHLSTKDEALLIFEYLESERMSETFVKFLDESKNLQQLRAQLYDNYEHSQSISPTDHLPEHPFHRSSIILQSIFGNHQQ